MKWCIEIDTGTSLQLAEVLDLFDATGERTDSLAAAEAMVVRYGDDLISDTVPWGGVHRIQ